ncbi:MAG: SIS domain-containing protein [Planctomycetaceae bacterium]|nr:SIS domain-containing protein [Planctomycetaceae bacterium]
MFRFFLSFYSLSAVKQKIKTYHELYMGILAGIDESVLTQAATLVRQTWAADKQIFTAGNGGSAALAVHLAADFGKNAAGPKDKQPRITSLCTNTSMITALGNDCGYENIFSYQLRNFLNAGDLVILISSSGNSPNVIKAAEYAKANEAKVVGMTGFSGGKLRDLSDISLHIPCNVYELVEDAHSFFCHAVVSACKRGN